MVQKTETMPIWVFLAFSSINSRKGALWLIGLSVAFSIYCVPWNQLFVNADWVSRIFLIHDWFAMMVPMTLWYWISLKWIDNNQGWKLAESKI